MGKRNICPMTPNQYRAALEKLGLSQRGAAIFLGVDERTSRRWIAGDASIPKSVELILRLMVKLNLKPDDLK